MDKRKAGIMTIVFLILSLPVGGLIGSLLRRVIDLTAYFSDALILLSIIVCIIASLVFYKSFTQ